MRLRLTHITVFSAVLYCRYFHDFPNAFPFLLFPVLFFFCFGLLKHPLLFIWLGLFLFFLLFFCILFCVMKIFRIVVVACCLRFRFVVTFPVSYFFRFYYVLSQLPVWQRNKYFSIPSIGFNIIYSNIYTCILYLYRGANIVTRICCFYFAISA